MGEEWQEVLVEQLHVELPTSKILSTAFQKIGMVLVEGSLG